MISEIITEVARAGGELRLGPNGAILGRRVPPALRGRVKAEKPHIRAALRHQQLQKAGVDDEGLRAVDDCVSLFDAAVTGVGPAPKVSESDRRRRRRRQLEPGEQVRLTEGGPWYTVQRVTESAAHLGPVCPEPIQTELPGARPKKARRGGHLFAVSPTAFVVERRTST